MSASLSIQSKAKLEGSFANKYFNCYPKNFKILISAQSKLLFIRCLDILSMYKKFTGVIC